MTTAPALFLQGSARIGGTPLFGPVTLEARAGDWTCLLGASGVGKSTLLRLIAGLDDVTDFTGTIRASDGAPLAGRLSLMAQDDLLMPWLTVLDNALLGARLRGDAPDRERALSVLGQLGLSDHAGKRPAALSGGQRQRAALARTLMEDRPVVLLDEPFSALDAGTRARMQELAARHLKGRTVLMVTHDPAEAARLGHHILIMEPDGLHPVTTPPADPPRKVDDPGLLRVQAALLTRLRPAS